MQSWYGSGNRINTWGYDGSGNVTHVGSMSRDFTYDGENRQKTAVIGGQATSYAYDSDGRRILKTAPDGTTVFVYDAKGQLAAEYSSEPQQGSGTTYITSDHLGSTRLVTDVSGTPVRCYDYFPFGQELVTGLGGRTGCFGSGTLPEYPAIPDVVSRKFTSKERDAETGLDFFGARYMSSAQGRFTGVDPELIPRDISNPQIWNKYAYAINNPLRFIDPDGAAAMEIYQLGKASFKVYSPQANFDPTALLSTIFPGQPGSNQRNINEDLAQFKQNQSSWWFPTQNNAEGGCTLGCTTAFTEQAVGISLSLTFDYDKNNNISGANIGWERDKTATFIGPNPPPTVTTISMMPGGMIPAPQALRVDINSNALKNLTPGQLTALSKSTGSIAVPAIRQALTQAISQEQKRRTDDQKKQNCQSGAADCGK